MKTIIKSLIILLFAGSLSACNRYENYNSERRTFYLTQDRDPDLIGWWIDGINDTGISYVEYCSDAKVYRHDKDLVTDIIYFDEFPKYYWYSDNGYIHTLQIRYGSDADWYKMREDMVSYYFSENKDTMYQFFFETHKGVKYIRTETPVID